MPKSGQSDGKPPKHLSARSKALWRELIEVYVFAPHELELLRVGLEALDRCDEAREVIAQEGSIYYDRFSQPKRHPATQVEAESRSQYLRCMRELSLEPGATENRAPALRGRYVHRD